MCTSLEWQSRQTRQTDRERRTVHSIRACLLCWKVEKGEGDDVDDDDYGVNFERTAHAARALSAAMERLEGEVHEHVILLLLSDVGGEVRRPCTHTHRSCAEHCSDCC